MSKSKEARPAGGGIDPTKATQQMLVTANKQLLDTNKLMLAFMAALLLQKHNGSAVLNKNDVEKNFYNYNVTWNPVIDGSEFFVLKAEPRTDVQ